MSDTAADLIEYDLADFEEYVHENYDVSRAEFNDVEKLVHLIELYEAEFLATPIARAPRHPDSD